MNLKNKYPLIIIVILFLFTNKLSAQTIDNFKAGEKEYSLLRYKTAIPYYLSAFRNDSSKVILTERLANCYRLIKDYQNAEKWYNRLYRLKETLSNNDLKYYAEALANNGKYKESEEIFNSYRLDRLNVNRPRELATIINKVNPFLSDSSQWRISSLSINTHLADFSPAYYKDKLVFATNRNEKRVVKKVYGWDLTPFIDLYYIDTAAIKKKDFNSNIQTSTDSKAKNYSYKYNDDDTPPTSNDSRVLGTFNLSTAHLSKEYEANYTPSKVFDKNINTEFHDGPATFTADGREIVFTRSSSQASKDGIYKLNLFTAQSKDSTWTNIKEFPFNGKEFSTGHPAISRDGKVLYFASDRPGGFGGSDIYYSLRNGDSWSEPVNMGELVNTEGEEMFPFVDHNGDLYYSSTGKVGLGGLDVFYVPVKDNKAVAPAKNLGTPINSNKDDFGFIINETYQSGYFSSNRNLNDDIFRFERIKGYKFDLEVEVVNERDVPLTGVDIELADKLGKRVTRNDNNGKTFHKLAHDTDYKVLGSKAGYESQTALVSTKGKTADESFKVKLVMSRVGKPKVVQVGIVASAKCDSLRKKYYVEDIFYDLDKSFIRKDAEPALKRLIALMKEDPTLKVIIGSHCDSRASVGYNIALSQRRSEEAKDYLMKRGVAGSRIFPTFFGKSILTNNCGDGVACPEDMQQRNRRSEFQILKNGSNLAVDCGFKD